MGRLTAPPAIAGAPARGGDEALRFVTGRRPVFEAVFADLAVREPGVCVRRGVHLAGSRRGRRRSQVCRTWSGWSPTRRGAACRPGRARHRVQHVDGMTGLAARAPQVEANNRGFVYYALPHHPTPPLLRDPTVVALGNVSVLSLPRGQRHLVGHRVRRQRRRPAQGVARSGGLHAGRRGLPAAGPLARRGADHRCVADGRGAGSAPPVRGRRTVRGHRIRRRRRRLFVHQPVGRAWAIGGCGARLARCCSGVVWQ